jgi:hypothetical protein
MAETVQQLVTDVIEEGQFDVSPARALRALNLRHRKMVVRSRCWRKTVSIGPTVAGQRGYAVPEEVIDIAEVTVNGQLYGNARHDDFVRGANGFLTLSGPGGVMARDDDEGGVELLGLIPTPEEAGLEILVLGPCRPADLDLEDDTTLKIPEDFIEQLVDGAIALLMRRMESRADLAQTFEQTFSDACEELRRQVERKYRGSGPQQIRVQGFNA